VRAVGTRVGRGDVLLESLPQGGPVPLAPADGVVIGTERVCLTSGLTVPAVVIEPDAATPPPLPAAPRDVDAALSAERNTTLTEWIDRLRASGVWADRWTSPDLLGQLHQALRRPVDTIVCNALDVDPALPVQRTIAIRRPRDVIAAVAALAHVTGANRSWVVIPEEKAEDLQAALRAVAGPADVRLVPTENRYPRPHPTLLVHALTGRRLRPGKLPTDAALLLLDAPAAAAVGALLLRDEPMLSSPLGVYDRSAGRAHLVTAAIGTALCDVVGLLGLSPTCSELTGGHPLRDLRLTVGCIPAAGELTIYAAPPALPPLPSACIRCAWCVEACPVRIQPAGLLEAAQRQDSDLADRYGLPACIECGICTFVCPSNLPLLQGIRTLRRREP